MSGLSRWLFRGLNKVPQKIRMNSFTLIHANSISKVAHSKQNESKKNIKPNGSKSGPLKTLYKNDQGFDIGPTSLVEDKRDFVDQLEDSPQNILDADEFTNIELEKNPKYPACSKRNHLKTISFQIRHKGSERSSRPDAD
ncbi:hypothetical protein DSO57_1027640 [Entomophthora muscae]|uniref:Uncharacterized protein n=1 Tax=Entomophthora muscae TaxID=34485 RepID=A0ACC2SQT2_9FUNG|nr:hypothetical protein DSO57_1027640 [Entomophthora muscae]